MNSQEELKALRNMYRDEIAENMRQRQEFQEIMEDKEKRIADLEAALEAEKDKNAILEQELEAEKAKNIEFVSIADEDPNELEEVFEEISPMVEAINIMTNGCKNISIPTGANPMHYRSLVVLKSAALLNEPCEERQGLVHSNGSLTCQKEQSLTGFQDNNDKGDVKGGKAHLQYFASMYEKPKQNGIYSIGENQTQKNYQKLNKNAKCLISLNKLKKDGTLGMKQGGVWKYLLREGEENEGFYERINEMLCV